MEKAWKRHGKGMEKSRKSHGKVTEKSRGSLEKITEKSWENRGFATTGGVHARSASSDNGPDGLGDRGLESMCGCGG